MGISVPVSETHRGFLAHVNLLLEVRPASGLPLESQRPQDSWASVLKMKMLSKAQSSLESESGAHIQIPRVTDPPTQSANRAAESGGKEEDLWRSCWDQRREGTVFLEMNNAGWGGWGGGSSSWAPSLFLDRLPQSRKPPSWACEAVITGGWLSY